MMIQSRIQCMVFRFEQLKYYLDDTRAMIGGRNLSAAKNVDTFFVGNPAL